MNNYNAQVSQISITNTKKKNLEWNSISWKLASIFFSIYGSDISIAKKKNVLGSL